MLVGSFTQSHYKWDNTQAKVFMPSCELTDPVRAVLQITATAHNV